MYLVVLDDDDLPGCHAYKAAMPSVPFAFRYTSVYAHDCWLPHRSCYSFPSCPFLVSHFLSPKSLIGSYTVSCCLCLDYFSSLSRLVLRCVVPVCTSLPPIVPTHTHTLSLSSQPSQAFKIYTRGQASYRGPPSSNAYKHHIQPLLHVDQR